MIEEERSGLSVSELFTRGLGVTYPDFTILDTQYTDVERKDISLKTDLGKGVTLQIPIIGSPMDTVMNAPAAVALAQLGGIGAIHYNYKKDDKPDIDAQIAEIEKVKRYQNGFIENPVTISPEHTIAEVIKEGNIYKVGGKVIDTFPVTITGKSGGKLVGLLRKQDYSRTQNLGMKVGDRMLSLEKLTTAEYPISLDDARKMLWNEHINYLLILDKQGRLKYLVTQTDVEKIKQYPRATKDENNRLRVLFAVETWQKRADERLERGFAAGADGVIIDTSQGFTVYEKRMLEHILSNYREKLLIGGNIST